MRLRSTRRRWLVRRATVLALGSLVALPIAWAVDGDVRFQRKGAAPAPAPGSDTPPALFPHWVHRIRFKCYACHPAIFEMKAGANAVTMDAIVEGKFCGACHNGQLAWGVSFETCTRCHVATK